MPAMEYLEDARSFGVTEASGRELGGPPKHPKLFEMRKVGYEATATYMSCAQTENIRRRRG